MTQYKNVILPSKIEIIEEDATKGIYEMSKLYPGYGHTLGNSIRRMLLSSISGAAITQLRVKGVSHEFSTIDGILEDVLTIVLNLKLLSIEINGDEPSYTIKLNKKGKGKITAADIETPSQVIIHNKDQHIAEITNENTELSIEMIVEEGIGFLPKEENLLSKSEVGTIVVDAYFSPIIRAFYEVNDMRVGNRTDFNKLRVHIETNGSIKPHDALLKAIETIILQLKAMSEYKRDTILKPGEEINEEKVLKMKVSNLPLTPSIIKSLEGENILTIGDVINKSATDILDIKGLGDKGLQDIRDAIAEFGMTIK